MSWLFHVCHMYICLVTWLSLSFCLISLHFCVFFLFSFICMFLPLFGTSGNLRRLPSDRHACPWDGEELVKRGVKRRTAAFGLPAPTLLAWEERGRRGDSASISMPAIAHLFSMLLALFGMWHEKKHALACLQLSCHAAAFAAAHALPQYHPSTTYPLPFEHLSP